MHQWWEHVPVVRFVAVAQFHSSGGRIVDGADDYRSQLCVGEEIPTPDCHFPLPSSLHDGDVDDHQRRALLGT